MNIELNVLKEVIDELAKSIEEKMKPGTHDQMNKYEAMHRLGTLSALVLNLYEKTEDLKSKDAIWELKHESDTLLERIFTDMFENK